jgi:hypothetical protein
LSEIPAKFGRVQSKFVQDSNTIIRIKRAYVLKDENTARTDFFLIINTGVAGAHRMYFLTASQVVLEGNLKLGTDYYRLKIGTNIEKYLITDPSRILQLTEDSINNTNFYENRENIFPELALIELNDSEIDPDFKIDLKYNLGLTYSIPEFFIEKKKEALEMMKLSIEAYEILKSFIVSTNPMDASLIAEEISRDYSSIFGSRAINLFDSNLYYRSRHHINVVDTLRNDNALNTFITSRKLVQRGIRKFLDIKQHLVTTTVAYEIVLTFNMEDFSIISQKHALAERNGNKPEGYTTDGICTITFTDSHIASRLKEGFGLDAGYVAMGIMEKIFEVKYY